VGIKSHAKVAKYWKKWSKLGIVEPSGRYPGRFRKICSLEEVGLTVPPLPGVLAEEQPEEEVVE
jgi:hypothetical protein